MNDNNLIKNDSLTPSERRERARKAGLASGQARRERKTLKDNLIEMLSVGDIQDNIIISLLEKAQNGDVKAFETIRDTIGEKPVEKTAQTDTEGNNILQPPVINILPVEVKKVKE